MRSRLRKLTDFGQSIWIDFLSRDLLVTGGLQELIAEHGVSGVTTNPTILERAIASDRHYAGEIRHLAALGCTPGAILTELAALDVAEAAKQLLPRWLESSGRDGYVSWEVDPSIAWNAAATTVAVRQLHDRMGAPNLLVKIPATDSGLQALEDSVAAGLSVNVTLIFSLERYAATVESYLRGLRRAADAEVDLSRVHSVASFFISRLDAAADALLDASSLADARALRGRLGIASAKLAYQHFRACFTGSRWQALRARGASPQRLLWASTSTKSPWERDVRYIEELIGPGTVTTMPQATLEAFEDHGRPVPGTLLRDVAGAATTFEELKRCGIDVRSLAEDLELDGVHRFARSAEGAIAQIAAVAHPAAA